jgi:hypothetical protein
MLSSRRLKVGASAQTRIFVTCVTARQENGFSLFTTCEDKKGGLIGRQKKLQNQAINPGSIILLCGHMLLVTPIVKFSLFPAV